MYSQVSAPCLETQLEVAASVAHADVFCRTEIPRVVWFPAQVIIPMEAPRILMLEVAEQVAAVTLVSHVPGIQAVSSPTPCTASASVLDWRLVRPTHTPSLLNKCKSEAPYYSTRRPIRPELPSPCDALYTLACSAPPFPGAPAGPGARRSVAAAADRGHQFSRPVGAAAAAGRQQVSWRQLGNGVLAPLLIHELCGSSAGWE